MQMLALSQPPGAVATLPLKPMEHSPVVPLTVTVVDGCVLHVLVFIANVGAVQAVPACVPVEICGEVEPMRAAHEVAASVPVLLTPPPLPHTPLANCSWGAAGGGGDGCGDGAGNDGGGGGGGSGGGGGGGGGESGGVDGGVDGGSDLNAG